MVDDIIYALTSIRGLLVISRTSALAYRSGPIDLQKIGQELGVRYAMSGSVRRVKDLLRISVELADVESGSVIWVDRYDGDISELFDLQERIATRIVWSLAPHVRESELKRGLRKRPENMNAYDLLLQAIDLQYRMNLTDFARAGELLRQSIKADDSYATAHAYAALWQIHNINQGWTTDLASGLLDAARLAAAAVARDPADGFALAIHAHTKAVLFRDYSDSFELFDRALQAAPGMPCLACSAAAFTLIRPRQNPRSNGRKRGCACPRWRRSRSFTFCFSRSHITSTAPMTKLLIWGRKSVGMNPRRRSNLRWLIGSHVALGQIEEARYLRGQCSTRAQAFGSRNTPGGRPCGRTSGRSC